VYSWLSQRTIKGEQFGDKEAEKPKPPNYLKENNKTQKL
jgi:hypothetical protein